MLANQTQHFISLGIPRNLFEKRSNSVNITASSNSLPSENLTEPNNPPITIYENTDIMEEDFNTTETAESSNILNMIEETTPPNTMGDETLDRINKQRGDYRSVTVQDNYDAWAEALLKDDRLNISDVPLIIPESSKKSGGVGLSKELMLILNWMSDCKPSQGSTKNLLTRLNKCKDFNVNNLPKSYKCVKSLADTHLKTTTFHKNKSKGVEYEYRDVFDSIAFLVEKYGDKMKWEYEENHGVIKGPMNSKGALEYQKKKMAIEKVILLF